MEDPTPAPTAPDTAAVDLPAPLEAESGRPSLTVFYDGGCPLCAREIGHYRRRPGAEAIRWIDVSAQDPSAVDARVSRTAALARMHALEGDRLLVGASVFRAMWARLEGWKWVAAVTSPAPIAALMEAGYRAFLVVRPLWRPRACRDGEACERDPG